MQYEKVRWPERIAVGMRQGDQLSPLTVEATKSGWIAVSFLSTRPDAGLKPPPFRLLTTARDIKSWAARARRLLDSPPSNGDRSAALGNGAYKIELGQEYLAVYTCGPGSAGSSPSVPELRDFIALLDSAADIAGTDVQPPTLSRPYYGSEVSCPASASPDNHGPRVPIGMTNDAPDIGTQFIVDTIGRVEAGSIEFLPGSDRNLVDLARPVIAEWRFRRAEIDGVPVRQLVQTTVGYARPPRTSLTDDRVVHVDATDDGWVHVWRSWGAHEELLHQWFAPDSVDRAVDRIWGRDMAGGRASLDTARLLRAHGLLGTPLTLSVDLSISKREDNTLELAAGFVGCNGSFNEGGSYVGDGSVFTNAARDARKRRATPVDPTTRVHTAADVACPAWLPWTRSGRVGFGRVWNYPVGIYPASMQATNARADIMISFVVDTTGAANLKTVSIMKDSDPRAVAAIPATLEAIRYRPATRSGRKVSQLVIETLRFEPPPTCATLDSGPACPRRYSDK